MEIFLRAIINVFTKYEFLNNLIPGTVLCILLHFLCGYDILVYSTYTNLVIIYFVGVVNSRIGSLLIELLLKKLGIVKFSKYPEYIKAKKRDEDIDLFTTISNSYRSYASVCFIVIVIYLYGHVSLLFEFFKSNERFFLILILFAIFIFSYKKQTSYVRKRVEEANRDNPDTTVSN